MSKCANCEAIENLFLLPTLPYTIAYLCNKCLKKGLKDLPVKYKGETVGKIVSVN